MATATPKTQTTARRTRTVKAASASPRRAAKAAAGKAAVMPAAPAAEGATASPVARPAKPQKAPKASKPAKADRTEKADKPRKPKMVRDSFTIPKAEYAVIDTLKQRSAKAGSPAKKSELLRAGIKALESMGDAAFLAAIRAVPAIKTGRPAKGRGRGQLPAADGQTRSGDWTARTTVCRTPSRTRVRSHQAAPLRTEQAPAGIPSRPAIA